MLSWCLDDMLVVVVIVVTTCCLDWSAFFVVSVDCLRLVRNNDDE